MGTLSQLLDEEGADQDDKSILGLLLRLEEAACELADDYEDVADKLGAKVTPPELAAVRSLLHDLERARVRGSGEPPK